MVMLLVSVGVLVAAARPLAGHAVSEPATPRGASRSTSGGRPGRTPRSRRRAGEVVAVIGPNGAGKSTLLRALAGLVAGRRASARLGGADLLDARPPATAAVGMVFQEPAALPAPDARSTTSPSDRAPAAPAAATADGARAGLARPLRRRRPRRPQAARSSPAARPSGSRSPGRWPPSPALLLLDEPLRRPRRRGRDGAADRARPAPRGVRRRHAAGHPRRHRRAHPRRPGAGARRRRVAQVGPPARGRGTTAHRPRRPAGRAQRAPRGRRPDRLHARRRRGVARREPEGSAAAPLAADRSPTLAPHGDAVRLLVHAASPT